MDTNRFAPGGKTSTYLLTGLTVAGIIAALSASIAGQRADRHDRGGAWLRWFSALVFLCLLDMFFVAPDSSIGTTDAMWMGAGLLGLGNIFFEFASVNYNTMLNHLTIKENMGRASGLGWGSGYVGGIVLLLTLYLGLIGPNMFGVLTKNGMVVRISMVIAASRLGLSALPVVLHPPRPTVIHEDTDKRESLFGPHKFLWGTARSLKHETPHILAFLIAPAVFHDGLAGVFTFGVVLVDMVSGFSPGDVMIFAIAASIVTGLATIAFETLDDRFGPKAVTVASLMFIVAFGLGIFFLHSYGKVVFWSLGLALCVFIGLTQSTSRSFLGWTIPKGREDEVLGLYTTTGRAMSSLTPLMYGVLFKTGQAFTPVGQDFTYWDILGVVLVLLVGLFLTIPVKAQAAHLDRLEG